VHEAEALPAVGHVGEAHQQIAGRDLSLLEPAGA
jgi:hypothetical protein